MSDPRWEALAEILINHSVRLEPGETLLIEAFDLDDIAPVRALARLARERGAHPLLELKDARLQRELVRLGDADSFRAIGDVELHRMKRARAYIALRGARNINEFSDVPKEKMNLYNEHVLKPVHFDYRIRHTKWCVLRLPNASMAQQAGMSTSAFEDFYFDACTVDYAKMATSLEPLIRRMEAAREVLIEGPETELRFSIEGIPVVPCAGTMNIPDGEVFTAPVRESVEGAVRFNTPTVYQGKSFDGIYLRFEQGRIVEADCATGSRDDLLSILDTDEGARYIGEWSIACHPTILHPMRDILFDEKIAGSFHFTPGNAYDEADNGNRSKVHWDLVQIQRPSYGGGCISFDGELIREDGRFVTDDLRALNPADDVG